MPHPCSARIVARRAVGVTGKILARVLVVLAELDRHALVRELHMRLVADPLGSRVFQ
jgi:hypothetical protein